MNKFYELLIERTEEERTKDQEREKRESTLLEIKNERTIPKLRLKKPIKKKRRRRR